MSDNTEKRKYKGKDVEMLSVIETMLSSAISIKSTLAARRPQWIGDHLEKLLSTTQSAYVDYLGINNARALTEASQNLYVELDQAIINLADFKAEIRAGFRKDKVRRDTLLGILGYMQFKDAVKNEDQEGIVQFLYHFSDNMTADIKAEIIATGTDELIFTALEANAENTKNLNIIQEGHKGSKKELTDESIKALNDIYDDGMGVAELAKKYLRGDAIKQEWFSYSKVLRNLNRQ